MTRHQHLIGLVSGIGALVLISMVSASKADESQNRPQAANGDIVLLYDGSNSMGGRTIRSERKFKVAQAAADSIIERLAPVASGHRMALVAFGHRVKANSKTDPPAKVREGCDDVRVERGLANLDDRMKAEFHATLAAFQPKGYTPITKAIKVAAQVLGAEGGTIVLITDADANCPSEDQEPCDVLSNINLGRPSSQRVYINSIIVPRSNGMKTEYLRRLEKCSGATYIEVASTGEATQKMGPVADQLATLGSAIAAPPRLHVEVIFQDGGSVGPHDRLLVEIRDRSGAPIPALRPSPLPSGPIALDPGHYQVALLNGEKDIMVVDNLVANRGGVMTIFFTP